MNITDVRIRKIVADGKLKAVASITLDNEFVVHDIKIIEGQNGLFIAMPSKKVSETEFRDIAHPIVSEARNKIRDVIFAEYEKIADDNEVEA
ncbi:MAG: septation regulator SpoVG [Anaerovoracaceae bacterium]|nr:septation regulator SpoVG [Anaerovoracaceae bacterium]